MGNRVKNAKRVKGGVKNEKSRTPWTKEELEKVIKLYFKLQGTGIHERNPLIIELGKKLGRATRTVEAQLIMFRSMERGEDYGFKKRSKLIDQLWEEYSLASKKTLHAIPDLSELFDWFGHRKGGVRIAFTDRGKPTKSIIRTDLIQAIDNWLENLKNDFDNTPSKLFFIGGPGNGKTEALDYAIHKLIEIFKFDKDVEKSLRVQALEANREIVVDLGSSKKKFHTIKLVPDASLGNQNLKNTAVDAMLADFETFEDRNSIYLCCINRGILQDVINSSKDLGKENALSFFSQLSSWIELGRESVGNSWPTQINVNGKDYCIGVWPMEVSSLFEKVKSNDSPVELKSPFEQVLKIALDHEGWANAQIFYKDNFINEAYCPLTANQKSLTKNNGESLRSLVKEYELIANRRITFREMLSLVVYILIGHEDDFISEATTKNSPHQYICELLKALRDNEGTIIGYEKAFKLSMLQWEFKLFNNWPDISRIIQDEAWKRILNANKGKYQACIAFQNLFTKNIEITPRTDLEKTLSQVSKLMDPSKLHQVIDYGGGFNPGKIDLYLQDSISLLIKNILNNEALNELDIEVLKFFSEVERQLDEIRSLNNVNSVNSIVERLNFVLKKVVAAYTKRKLGAFFAVSSESDAIQSYNRFNDSAEVTKVIEDLLDIRYLKKIKGTRHGEISIGLNSTFGQPNFSASDIYYKCTIAYSIEVYQPNGIDCNQPVTQFKYLRLSIYNEQEVKSFSIPLSYHFVKAIKDIGKGLKKGTLHREIVATFDRMKSFLEGIAVHSIDDESEIAFPSGVKMRLLNP